MPLGWNGINPQDLQPLHPGLQLQAAALGQPGVYGMIRQGQIPTEDGYEVAKIYREARDRILEELKMQVEINHKLGRELIDLRLDHAELQSRYDDLLKATQEPPPQTKTNYDECPF